MKWNGGCILGTLTTLAILATNDVLGLNYTGETALLDAAPEITNRRHATAVTFGELGVFDFRGDGRARVALELGAFSSEKDTAAKKARTRRATAILDNLLSTGSMNTTDTGRPVRDADPIELDHVYLIFAKARAVNNFVARLHTAQKKRRHVGGGRGADDETAALMLCSDVGSWLESEFVAPITALKRPQKKVKPEAAKPANATEAKHRGDGEDAVDEKPKISFISASAPTAAADILPRPTRVTGIQKRELGGPADTETPSALGPGSKMAGSSSVSSSSSSTTAVSVAATDGPPLLGNESKAKDVFLVEYEWEWLVHRGGEYAVVIANCAATTIQFKYNLIMANRWHDGQWTNLPAGWMPVQQVYPAVCYTLWAFATACWVAQQAHAHFCRRTRPVMGVVLGFVPVLRFMSCLADQSRYNLWGSGSYEVTMIVVSTSLVDALADGAHLLAVLALAKGWGVVRARLAGTEKRLVPGIVVFVGVATLYDGATRGGGVLAVGVLQMVAVWYACASLAHTRRVHAVQTLRLVSRNEAALAAWWSSRCPGSIADDRRGEWSPAVALALLARCSWKKVEADCQQKQQQQGLPLSGRRQALALMWSAARKERLLRRIQYFALPLQLVDLAVLLAGSFAVPPHRAYVGLLLVQAAHWTAFMAVFLVLALGGLEIPDVALPALPAIATRRSIPLPPPNASALSPRPLPPLGRLRLLRSNAPFAASSSPSPMSSS
ncbi:hypothetical protein LPJ56_000787 [Coemansia sp. RSA 2599]|nr:hypothetical protein LPJ56_000787 [Coemansia sp. RSA 2599]